MYFIQHFTTKHRMFEYDILVTSFHHTIPSFIGRRNASAHGDFSRILIEEQMHGYIIKDPNDLIKLINNKDASLDQYSKASDFIVEAFKIFDQRYP